MHYEMGCVADPVEADASGWRVGTGDPFLQSEQDCVLVLPQRSYSRVVAQRLCYPDATVSHSAENGALAAYLDRSESPNG